MDSNRMQIKTLIYSLIQTKNPIWPGPEKNADIFNNYIFKFNLLTENISLSIQISVQIAHIRNVKTINRYLNQWWLTSR